MFSLNGCRNNNIDPQRSGKIYRSAVARVGPSLTALLLIHCRNYAAPPAPTEDCGTARRVLSPFLFFIFYFS
jgi:hypothetical protein